MAATLACGAGGPSGSTSPQAETPQVVVQVTPSPLAFGDELVNATTPAIAETLINTGTANLSISSVTLGGTDPADFAQVVGTCAGTTLPPLQSCYVSLTFTPQAAGARSATLSFTDSAASSPQSVVMTGTGTAPAVSFSAPSLNFPNQVAPSVSSAQMLTLTNSGTGPLTIFQVSAGGNNPSDFPITSNSCSGATIPAGQTCTLSIDFSPSITGNLSASITFTDSASDSPESVTLTGVGIPPPIQLSPGSLSFAPTAVGVSSSPQTITLQNDGQGTVALTSISASGDFSQVSTCLGSLGMGASCEVQVTFKASTAGLRKGTLSLITPTTNVAQTISLEGVGNGPLAGVYTQRYDNARSGQNVQEDYLTTSNVTSSLFGKLFTLPVNGQVYAQPLYLENVAIPGQGTHNVVYVVTENDSVYAFDADGLTTTPLWYTSLINPAQGVTTVPATDVYTNSFVNITNQIGITSTPVIDPTTGTMYLDAVTKEATVPTCTSGCTYNYFHRLHALDVTTGQEKFGGPVAITASVSGTGYDAVNGTVTFNALRQLQRPGLMLLNGVVYIGFGSYADIDNYHGWLMAYNAATLQQIAVFNVTPNSYRGALWNAGGGLSADSEGNVYVVTANGGFDANTGGNDYSDSVLKMQIQSGQFQVLDYFTPYDQSSMNQSDLDLGSSPALILPDQPGSFPHLLATGGKDGRIWLLNRDNLGQFQANDAGAVQVLPQVGSDRLFGGGGYWNGNLYFQEQGEPLNQFLLSNGMMPASANSSTSGAFSSSPNSSPIITSNGTNNAIVWMVLTDLYNSNGPAELFAFQATDVSNETYDSTQAANNRDKGGAAVKFVVPLVANGRVYLGTQTEVDVYGLLN